MIHLLTFFDAFMGIASLRLAISILRHHPTVDVSQEVFSWVPASHPAMTGLS